MSILLAIFVDNLLPVFIVIGAGVLLGVTLRPDVKAVSRTTFYTLTPCLIFSGLLNTPLTGDETQQVAAFAILATLTMAAVAWLIATVLGWRDKRRRALVLPGGCGTPGIAKESVPRRLDAETVSGSM